MRCRKLCMSALLITFMFGLSATMALAEESAPPEDILLIIDNALYTVPEGQPAPMLVDDRVYVPLRLVSQALGYEVVWQEESKRIFIGQALTDQAAWPVEASEEIQIIIENTLIEANEETGRPFLTEDGYTMLPLRLVGTALNCMVSWEQGVVIVTSPPPVVPVETSRGALTSLSTATSIHQETPLAVYELGIFGEATASQAQIEAFLADKEKALRQKAAATGTAFIPYPDNIAALYLDLGKKYNIRGDIALAQALKETGYFQFQGSVQWFQNNYCGLGATGIALTGEEPLNGVNPLKATYLAGMHGISFTTPAIGVEAHLQHLYAYACSKALPAGCELVDPRFIYVQRGVSPRWVDLDGHWAVPGDGYGESILDDYWRPMLGY